MQGVDDKMTEYISSASKELGFSVYVVAILENGAEGSASGSKSKPIDPSTWFAANMNGVPVDISNVSLNLTRDVVNKDQTSAQNPDEGLRSARKPCSCSLVRPDTGLNIFSAHHDCYILIHRTMHQPSSSLSSFCFEYMKQCYLSGRPDAGLIFCKKLLKLYQPQSSSQNPEEQAHVIRAIMHSVTKHPRNSHEKQRAWIQMARQINAVTNLSGIDPADLRAACTTFSGSSWSQLSVKSMLSSLLYFNVPTSSGWTTC